MESLNGTVGSGQDVTEHGRLAKLRYNLSLNIRYLILVLTVVCLASIMANIITFNFTVLCMTNGTSEHGGGYTKSQSTIIFSSVAIGALIAVVPITYLIQVCQARAVFFACGILTGVATALVPIAANQANITYFAILRILQGISFAACMPTAGTVTSSWAPAKQHGLFISSLTSFPQVAGIFTMLTSGQLCDSKTGWPMVYYIHAIISIIFFTLWFAFYRDEIRNHPMIQEIELKRIRHGKPEEANSNNVNGSEADKHQGIPYRAILVTPVIWGVWFAAFGDLMMIQLIHTFSPQYIRQILGYSIKQTGLSATCPVLFQFIIKLTAGHSSDKVNCLSEKNKLRLYNSIALGLSSVFIVLLAFLPKNFSLIGVILLTLSAAVYGFNGGGFNKCATVVSQQYGQFVFGHIQIIWCAVMLISPILVEWMLVTNSLEYWRVVFLVHAAISVICNFIFCLVASAKPAWWTDRSLVEQRRWQSKTTA